MTQINQALFRLRATTSTNEKVEILAALGGDKIAKEVLNWALNPYITFGITAIKRILDPLDNLQDTKSLDSTLIESWPELEYILGLLSERKLVGGPARMEVDEYTTFQYNGRLAELIINKDLRAGINIKLVNRAIPGLIPTFVVGKAADIRRGAIPTYPCLAEPKYDGVRVLAMFGPSGDVQLMSSGGREYMNFPHIQKELMNLGYKNKILDGEVYGDTFDKTMRVAHRGRSKKGNAGIDDAAFIYNVFDILDTDEFSAGVCSYSLAARRPDLQMTLTESIHVRLTHGMIVSDEEDMWVYHDEIVALGYEGLILKDMYKKYPFKRTSNAWIKVKKMHTYKGIVFGHYEGKGKFLGTLGGLKVKIDGVVTKVGSGFSDEERESLWTTDLSLHGMEVVIQGQELTKDGCVRFPVFVKFEGGEVL